MKHFKKIKLASAISLAVMTLPAQAVVDISGQQQLADTDYGEALKWVSNNGESLDLSNVNVNVEVPEGGIPGLRLDLSQNGNKVTITDSSIVNEGSGGMIVTGLNSGGEFNLTNSTVKSGYIALDFENGSQNQLININNSSLSGGAWDSGIKIGVAAGSDSLTDIVDTTLNITESDITGNRGIYLNGSSNNTNNNITITNSNVVGTTDVGLLLEGAYSSSAITLDNTKLQGVGAGIKVADLNNSAISINNGSSIVSDHIGIQVSGEGNTLNVDGSTITAEGSTDGAMAVFLADSNNATVTINNSALNASMSENEVSSGQALYIQSTNYSKADISNSQLNGGLGFLNSSNNVVNLRGSSVKGGINFAYDASALADSALTASDSVNFDNSYLEGSINISRTGFDSATKASLPQSHVSFTNGSQWKATGTSSIEDITVTDSTVDIQDAIVGADNWTSQNANLLINSGSELSIGTGNGDLNVVIKSDGKELETAGKDIIRLNNGNLDIHADAVDVGAYKYELVNKGNEWVLVQSASDQTDNTPGDQTDNTPGDQTGNTPGDQTGNNSGDNTSPAHPVLSNSANAVLSSLAASQASWNSQTSTLYERMGSRLEKDTGGVWGSYYGNEWAGKAGQSSTFNQKINGLAIGADKTLKLQNGTLTLGAAIMHDYSHLSDFDEKGSGGSMNSTALQAYGNLELDNGLFFKGTASAGRTDSSLHARSSDGALAQGDYKQTLFGLTGQAGYRYQITEDVYVAPYAQMNSYTASGVDFKLDNGMKVSSDRYWSARGELGIEAGMKTSVGGIEVTPHIMAAGSHEFVKNNDVRLNNLHDAFDNTVDGSGYRFGAGVEAQLTKSFSAGVNVSYSRSKDVEQRYDISAGLRYSF